MIIIKKYLNRKLYSQTTSSYVTLNHILELVKQGKEFKVIDENKVDITRKILAQVIVQVAESFTEEELKGFIRSIVRG